MSKWNAFPHSSEDYQYDGDDLREHWDRLHEGDHEPFPDADYVSGFSADVLDGQDPEELAAHLQDAWRAYHQGDFQAAAEAGRSLGPLGAFVANKASGIYSVYLETDEKRKLAAFQEIAEAAEEAAEQLPDHANSHYFRAFALGRYSQGISVMKALKQGLGGQIQNSLQRALELDPDHPDANTAMGLYHAEVLDKVGSMIGGLTYGANDDDARQHFEIALEQAPNSAITRIEVANGLMMLDGDNAYDRASDLYVEASEMEPADAMERLDVELALSELE